MSIISEEIDACNWTGLALPYLSSPTPQQGRLTSEDFSVIQETMAKLFPVYSKEFEELKGRCNAVQYCAELPFLLVDNPNKTSSLKKSIEKMADREELLRTIQVARSFFPEKIQSIAIRSAVSRFANIGDYDQAMELAFSLDREEKRSALRDIAKKMADRGDLTQALEIAQLFLPEWEWAEHALTTRAIQRLANIGSFDEALELTDALNLSMAKSSEEARWDYDETDVFSMIALAMAEQGDYARCLDIVNTKFMSCHSPLYDVVCIMIRKGDCGEALKVYHALEGMNREYALIEIGIAFAEKREYDQAMDLFQEIKEPWNRYCAVCEMLEIALGKGDISLEEIEDLQYHL